MTRNQQRINTIQNAIGKLTDVGSRTEIDNEEVRILLEQAQRILDEAYAVA